MTTIPFVNLEAQYANLEPEIMAAVQAVFRSFSFLQGPATNRFEARFAQMHGARFANACSNGTSAIALALEAAGVGPGDEVITTPHTFIATVEGIRHVGAKPMLADIDPRTANISPDAVAAAIGPRTRALLPVHLYGNPCDLDALVALAKRHDLVLVEDAAQAHLAEYKGKRVGTFGAAATFSFYPGKNLGAMGDAGLVFSATEEHAHKVRKLLNHGRIDKYRHDVVGYNYRMDDVQSAILSVKLNYLEAWTKRRRQVAAQYRSLLEPKGFTCIQPTEGAKPVYHLFVVQAANRDEVAKELHGKGIATGVHYPVPLHLQPALESLGYRKGAFPVTEAMSETILSLPICAEITDAQVELVAREFLRVARPAGG